MIATTLRPVCDCAMTMCPCLAQQDLGIIYSRGSSTYLDVMSERIYERIEVDFDPNRPASARRPRPWVLAKMKLLRSKRDPRPQSRGPGAHRRPCY